MSTDVDTTLDPFGNPNTPPATDAKAQKPKLFPLKPGQKRDKNGRPYQAKRGPYNYKKEPAAIAPATPPPDAPPPPSTETPAPKPPPEPKGETESRRALDLACLTNIRTVTNVCRFPPAERVSRCLEVPAANHDVRDRPGFVVGHLGAFFTVLTTATRVSAHAEALRAFLLSMAPHWQSAMTPWAAHILEHQPDLVTLWRAAGPRNKAGLCWCSTPEAARAYSRFPALREREPVLVEALIDKARIAHLRETLSGFECVALAEASDIVSQSPIPHAP